MLMIWFNKPHDIKTFTPAWAFLVFPMMLVGVVSFNVLRVMDPGDDRALGVLLVGYFFQGLGFFMTFFYISIYILRIMTTGFMDGHQANGAFVACGPPGFTALALLNLGARAREMYVFLLSFLQNLSSDLISQPAEAPGPRFPDGR
jgi:tellurite resistance protein TehA-like permease